MRAEDFADELHSQFEKQGLKAAVIPFARTDSVKTEIDERYQRGEFEERFYRAALGGFHFEPPESLPGTRSVIIVATPQPQTRVSFTLNGRVFPVIIPPTYSYATDRRGKHLLEELLRPNGYQVVRAALPLKLLAVHSGLARYGRNNITYVPGLGSFHRLTAFCTDYPCAADDWGEPEVMKRCQTCTACLEACPTGAIVTDRFLIHAERCITFLNEFPGEFPGWLDPAWHNCIVGCLHCQKCCPVNKRVVDWIEDRGTFSDGETRLILAGVPKDDLPEEMIEKMKGLGILDCLEVLPRNLRVLAEQ